MALNRQELFERRQRRARFKLRKVSGLRPRLSVFRSSKHISAQLIDDTKGVTVASASTLDEAFKKSGKKGSDKTGAAEVGKHEVILVLDIESIVEGSVIKQKGGSYV